MKQSEVRAAALTAALDEVERLRGVLRQVTEFHATVSEALGDVECECVICQFLREFFRESEVG